MASSLILPHEFEVKPRRIEESKEIRMGGRMGGQIRNKPQTLIIGELRAHAQKSNSLDEDVIYEDDFDSIGEE